MYNEVMFAPDVEARFKKIEDAQVATAELQRGAELRAQDDIERLAAIQNAMARWQDDMAEKQNILIDAQIRGETEMKASIQEAWAAITELSRTVDRSLKVRSNGGSA